ncbi:hypothetical protein IYX23_02925 [Methylocystis sp. L43]|uniref:hypothetical protein n=1 Tax=unclassified Methylocystis TaxID=2625913 RepID=UPI0018C3383D|nr:MULTISPECIES: hypothetical protein [unclassified Methylocystis]MBG0796650.1 hypothetical protein [Methylocystis sp. L43]MBG0804631.1 hypothetical protein [Methylocystis sp. H15]
MIRNTKTEKAHRALRQFLTPKLRPGFALDCTPFFIGCDDGNIADRLDDVVGAVCRATSGDLTCDVAVPELKRKMKNAVEEDGTKNETSNGVDQSVVDRVMALLEMKLLPTELAAVKQILTQPSKKQRAASNSPEDIGEDAKNAKIAYAARFPSAARIKIEPVCTPEPQRQVTPDIDGYARRFPGAMRIRQA